MPSQTAHGADAVAPHAGGNGPTRAAEVLVGVVLLVLVGAVAYFASASHHNRAAAARWQARATQLEQLLTARTAQLSQRDAALNRTTKELTSLNAQVAALESRQRNLVSQKAQVEDQRGLLASQADALAKLAGEQSACNDNLTALFEEYASRNYAWVDAHAATVQASCQDAQDAFDTFQTRYGGG